MSQDKTLFSSCIGIRSGLDHTIMNIDLFHSRIKAACEKLNGWND